jgi:dUTPase
MRLKIRRLDPTIPLPSYGTDEAAGFDLAAAADVAVAPAGRSAKRTVPTSTGFVGSQATRPALVRTGLVIEVPAGHFLGIFARSSTPHKRGLLGTVRESGPSGQRWLVGARSAPTPGSASSIPIIPAQTTKS